LQIVGILNTATASYIEVKIEVPNYQWRDVFEKIVVSPTIPKG